MRNKTLPILFFFLLIALPTRGESQIKQVFYKQFYRNKIPQKMPVLVRYCPVYLGNSLYRVYFLVEVKYQFLQFLYNDGTYEASGESEFNITNTNKGDLRAKIFQAEVQVDSYDQTNRADLYHLAIDSLDIPEGNYEVNFKYHDANSQGRQIIFEFPLELPHIKGFYVSPPLFIEPETVSSWQEKHMPFKLTALEEYWDFNRNMGIQINVWNSDLSSPLNISMDIINLINPQIRFSVDTVLINNHHRKSLNVAIPAQTFTEGQYQINIKYLNKGQPIEHIFPLAIVWFTKPFSLWEIKTAMGPMKYLMDKKDYDYLTDGKDEEQLLKFNAFWKEKDPSPETPFNELQNEFYTRVDSAIIRYGSKGRSGWNTDIGKIYILYGQPDEVEDRSLAPIAKPYLRWTYYLENKLLKITFSAVAGRKYYKLLDMEEIPL
jgi:GWxTD domain-containing protein